MVHLFVTPRLAIYLGYLSVRLFVCLSVRPSASCLSTERERVFCFMSMGSSWGQGTDMHVAALRSVGTERRNIQIVSTYLPTYLPAYQPGGDTHQPDLVSVPLPSHFSSLHQVLSVRMYTHSRVTASQ